MKEIISRLKIIAAIIGAGTVVYYLWGWASAAGNTAAATPGASNYWGFEWALSNLHWLILLVIVIVGFIVLLLERKKRF